MLLAPWLNPVCWSYLCSSEISCFLLELYFRYLLHWFYTIHSWEAVSYFIFSHLFVEWMCDSLISGNRCWRFLLGGIGSCSLLWLIDLLSCKCGFQFLQVCWFPQLWRVFFFSVSAWVFLFMQVIYFHLSFLDLSFGCSKNPFFNMI